jgi:hypothetical protein
VRVTFNELAERELNDAIQYFEREQSGLGAAFWPRCVGALRASQSIRRLARWLSAASGGGCASVFHTACSMPSTGARFAYWLS